MTSRHHSNDSVHSSPRDSAYAPHRRDPYQENEKWPEATKCPDCGLVFQAGRWQRVESVDTAHSTRCPACARIHDRVPAGILFVGGGFFFEHRDEVLNLVRNCEQRERTEHPLERIMGIEEGPDGIAVSYTGIHLARGTGEALHDAFQGELGIDYNDRDAPIRVNWHRS